MLTSLSRKPNLGFQFFFTIVKDIYMQQTKAYQDPAASYTGNNPAYLNARTNSASSNSSLYSGNSSTSSSSTSLNSASQYATAYAAYNNNNNSATKPHVASDTTHTSLRKSLDEVLNKKQAICSQLDELNKIVN